MAPAPSSGPNTCDEWPVMPVTSRRHEVVPRRAMTACAGRRRRPRSRCAAAAPVAAVTSACRAGDCGRPGASSSPVITTVMFMRSSAPAALSAFKRLQHDDVAALHVDDARAARVIGVDVLEFLERTVGIEDRVEVADEQNLRRRTRMRRHQVARPAPRRAVDPRRS